MQYQEDPRFTDYYFEDSYVLGISIWPQEIKFYLDAVLLPTHSHYTVPPPHEAHCFQRATLHFSMILDIKQFVIRHYAAVDASGEVDFGNIDKMEVIDSDRFRLSGDWGEIDIVSKVAEVKLQTHDVL